MIQIAIPTYRRYDTVCDKTLTFLLGSDAKDLPITLFVANEAEKEAYWSALWRRRWQDRVSLVVGKLGLGPQRNFIQSYYPEGTWLWQLDDDIRGLCQRASPKRLLPLESVKGMAETAFGLCQAHGIGLWGVHPVDNPFFMDPSITFDLRYCPGGCFGVIVRHDSFLDVRLEDKEDFERTLRYYSRDGRVIRLNWVCMKTEGYLGAGGMQETRTKERVRQSARQLARWFPTLCRVTPGGKRGFVEVKLRDGGSKKVLHTEHRQGEAKNKGRAHR